MRTRVLLIGVTAAVLVALQLPGAGARPGGRPLACPAAVRGLGWVAFAGRGQLDILNLATCRLTARRAGNVSKVRFSPDGRWLAFSRLAGYRPSAPVVVPIGGGAARSPLGAGILAWTWGPRGARLYGITSRGALLTAGPTGGRRVVLGGVGRVYDASFAVSPNGERAAVNRSRCGSSPTGELDTVDLRTGARRVALTRRGRFFTFAGWSPDGRWLLYWSAGMCSASLAADGWPLEAVPASGGRPVQVVRHMLLYGDFLSWCGRRLVAAAGADRETQTASGLVESAPPAWRVRAIRPAGALSWVSPSCAPAGRMLAAAAGAGSAPVRFGLEHRSIWLLRPAGAVIRRLSTPPARDLTDEAPRFSRDGRWILFVRTRVAGSTLAATSADTIELEPASAAAAPIPVAGFSSHDLSYYDHFGWSGEVDWYQPR
jgi:hypothetical protein